MPTPPCRISHEWSANEWPERWRATRAEADEEARDDDAVWTLSPNPDETGWENDLDCPGYGLPRKVAERICRILNGEEPAR